MGAKHPRTVAAFRASSATSALTCFFLCCSREGRAMTIFTNTFGLAMRNFTTWPEMPDPQGLIDYARYGRGAGFQLGLGVGPHPARRRPAVPGHRLADPARRDRRAHHQDQARHRRPGFAVAQPCGSGKGIVEPRPDRRRPAAARHGIGLVQARIRCGRHPVSRARSYHGPQSRNPAPVVDRGPGQRRIPAACPAWLEYVAKTLAIAADRYRWLCRPRLEDAPRSTAAG